MPLNALDCLIWRKVPLGYFICQLAVVVWHLKKADPKIHSVFALLYLGGEFFIHSNLVMDKVDIYITKKSTSFGRTQLHFVSELH